MDRMQELNDILNAPTPPALEGAVTRAKKKYTRSKIGKVFGIPVASLCGVAAAFVLLVNTSIPFALACGNVPILKEFAAAVAFSPSLKAAVENDYVLYVGKTQKIEEITITRGVTDNLSITLEYFILDQSQLILFFSTDSMRYNLFAELVDEHGQRIDGSSGYLSNVNQRTAEGGLQQITISLFPTQPLPQQLFIRFGIPSGVKTGGITFPHSTTFQVDVPHRFTSLREQIVVDRWFELDGQRLYIGTLDVYPLSTCFTLEEDPNNTATAAFLDLSLVDENGVHYVPGKGFVYARGNTYYLGSSYFSETEHLSLEITGALWLDKGKERTTVHLDTRTAEHMPEGASISALYRNPDNANNVTIGVRYTGVGGLFAPEYYDPEGGKHRLDYIRYWSYNEENSNYFVLLNYPWDSVTLVPLWNRAVTFDDPVTIPLK